MSTFTIQRRHYHIHNEHFYNPNKHFHNPFVDELTMDAGVFEESER